MSDCAFLNNSGNFTAFTYNGRTIRFRTPSSLERYTDILEWDKGYLVVMAKYKGAPAEEEYMMLSSSMDQKEHSRRRRVYRSGSYPEQFVY